MEILHAMVSGLDLPSLGLTVNRLVVGVFFIISGYHKLTNRGRHESLRETLQADGIPLVWLCCWLVPAVEFLGGAAVTVGVLAPLGALGLLVICLVATVVDGIYRIPSYSPIDRADWLDDLLYLPEVLYIAMLLTVILVGPGPVVLDRPVLCWVGGWCD